MIRMKPIRLKKFICNTRHHNSEKMTIFQAELTYYFRSPIIWIIAALSAFISAWSMLMAIDIFVSMQVKFASMTDAPTILQGVIFPVVSAQAKLLLLIVPIIAGLSFSRLHNNNGWSLINMYALSEIQLILQKYLAVLLVCFVFIFPTFISVIILVFMTNISLFPIFCAFIGLLLMLFWMLGLCLYISSLVSNSGFAILLSIVTLFILWMLSFSGLDIQWGKNWIQVFSPHYHYRQFLSTYLSVSSLYFFIVGVLFWVWAIKIRLIHMRYRLTS